MTAPNTDYGTWGTFRGYVCCRLTARCNARDLRRQFPAFEFKIAPAIEGDEMGKWHILARRKPAHIDSSGAAS